MMRKRAVRSLGFFVALGMAIVALVPAREPLNVGGRKFDAASPSVKVSRVSTGQNCHCRPAANDEVPSGGHEVVTLTGGTMRELRGTLADTNGAVIEDAVVEVYRLDRGTSANDAFKVASETQRMLACVTGEDGLFCFAGLPPGRYVLRAGPKSSGWNPIYVTVRINPHKRSDPRKGLVLQVNPAG